MNIIQKPAHPNNYGVGRNGLTVNKIVLHWIVGSLSSADTTFANPLRKASATYGVGPNEIHQYVKEEDTAWHASNLTVNRESIGIEHEGGWLLPDGTRAVPTEETLRNSAELVADICKRYNLPIDRNTIHVHNEYKPTTCPGSLNVDRIIALAKEINTPPVVAPVTDQSKYDFGQDFGVMELQAARSKLQELKNKANDQNNQINSLNLKIIQIKEIVK